MEAELMIWLSDLIDYRSHSYSLHNWEFSPTSPHLQFVRFLIYIWFAAFPDLYSTAFSPDV